MRDIGNKIVCAIALCEKGPWNRWKLNPLVVTTKVMVLPLQQCYCSRSLPLPLYYFNGTFSIAIAQRQWLQGSKLQRPPLWLQFFMHSKNNHVFKLLKLEITLNMFNMVSIFTREARTIEVLNIKLVYYMIHTLNKGNSNPENSNKIKSRGAGKEYSRCHYA